MGLFLSALKRVARTNRSQTFLLCTCFVHGRHLFRHLSSCDRVVRSSIVKKTKRSIPVMTDSNSKASLSNAWKQSWLRCIGAMLFVFLVISPSVSASLSTDAAGTASGIKKNRTLIVGVTPRPVFVNVDNQGNLDGLDIALAKAIFAEAGLSIRFEVYPWKRIVHLLESGDVDVALSASDSDQRREFAYFSSEAFRLGHNLLFTRKEHSSLFDPNERLQQLEGMSVRLGVQRGVSYSYEYDTLLSSAEFQRKLVVVDTPARLVELMLIDRVDAFLGSERDLQTEIDKYGAHDQIVPLFYLMSDKEASSHIMFSKASVPTQWVEKVNQAMRSLKASGRYDEIMKSY
ncbi:transporter substrate-binding domain-containing protein [Alteromonas sp. KUL42]|nr:transporter substrate-binding domain-containing protein [Alteromonas sp. KUL42]